MSKKKLSIIKLLEKIRMSGDFSLLFDLRNPDIWTKIPPDEQEKLASLFVLQGNVLLHDNDKSFAEAYDMANTIAPNHLNFLLVQAKNLSAQKLNTACLKRADSLLDLVFKLDPDNLYAHIIRGTIYGSLAIIHNESQEYFFDSIHHLEKAESLPGRDEHDNAEIHWNKGLCYYYLGRSSGEAVDFFKAVDSFKKVQDQLKGNTQFLCDFASAYTDLAVLTNRTELFSEAIALTEQVTKLDPMYYDGWLSQAIAYNHIFDATGDLYSFEKADECYMNAAKLAPDLTVLWAKWGTMQLSICRRKENTQLLESAIEKFQAADKLQPNNIMILNRWAEALIWLGSSTEQLHLIKEAEKKIIVCLEISPKIPDLWHNLGFCYNEMGHYFKDTRYFLKAIESFQEGLNLNAKSQMLWYGTALSYYSIAEIEEDPTILEKALFCFSKVFENYEEYLPPIWNDFAIALIKMTELTNDISYIKRAITALEQQLRINEIPEGAQVDPDWYYHYGCALHYLGDWECNVECYEKAISSLAKALEIDPSHPHANFNLAQSYSHLGELTSEIEYLQKALEYFQEALGKDSEDGYIWNEVGLVYINIAEIIKEPFHPERTQKLFEQAEAKFLKALSLGCLDALYNLACLYSLSGNFSAAMHYIEKAERSDMISSIDELLNDEWLEPLRDTEPFRNFIANLSLKQGLEE